MLFLMNANPVIVSRIPKVEIITVEDDDDLLLAAWFMFMRQPNADKSPTD